MLRRGFLLLCLLMASLTTASVTHAREFFGEPTIECSGYVHTLGDDDHSEGDSDKTAPHHHGVCHGSAVFMPHLSGALLLHRDPGAMPLPWDEAALTGKQAETALRPPIA